MFKHVASRFALSARLALVLMITAMTHIQAGSDFPLALRDQMERTVIIAKEPRRIISTSPACTEILFALGLGVKVVGVTKWCNYPPEAAAIEKIGDLIPLDLEKIVALCPDLVVADELNGRNAIDTLSGLGLTVLAMRPTSFADILSSIDLIGQATDTEDAAAALAADLQQTLDRVSRRSAATKAKGLRVFILLGWDPFWTAGPGSFLDEAVALAGGSNIAHDLGAAWGEMNLEVIMQRNPDVIVTDIDPAKIYADPVWRKTAAAQKNQVYRIVGDEYYRPGPRLIDALEDLAALLEKSA